MNNPKRKMTPIQWFKLLLGIALVSPIAYYAMMIIGDILLELTDISKDAKPVPPLGVIIAIFFRA